jgi:predicted metal-dependent peptidase
MEHKKIVQARVNLVLEQPFFGTLALRLDPVADPSCKTAWVDGRRLGYNPSAVEQLSLDEVEALLAVKIMQVANGHPWRRDGRDLKRWSRASEMCVSSIVAEAGFSLPPGTLTDAEPGRAVEQIYSTLYEPPPSKDQKQEQGDGDGAGGGAESGAGGEEGDSKGGGESGESAPEPACGEVRDADPDDPAQEEEWRVATLQAAAQAKQQGKLPASLERLVDQLKKSHVDWRTALRRFVQQAADYSWKMPNPRFVPSGLYLPALRSETTPPLVVAIDTSGSIGQIELDAFGAEIAAIMDDCAPEALYVIYCDAAVQRVDEFQRGDDITLSPRGGGGTDFRPVFKRLDREGLMPACVIYLTDLEGTFPDRAPETPVLWVSTTDRVAPWGETIKMEV